MMNQRALILRLIFLSGLTSASVQAATQEGVTYDPQTGNYAIAYKAADIDGNEFLDEVTFVPATKIAPVVKVRFAKKIGSDSISYQYSIKNKDTASQAILGMYVPASTVGNGTQTIPSGWSGSVSKNYVGQGLYVSWSYRRGQNPLAGLTPGYAQTGFGVESSDLPGVVEVELDGATPLIVWAGEIDPASEVGKQVNQLETSNFVRIASAVPRISVPSPYDAATVLTNIQKHLDTDLVGLKLVGPALVTELDRWLDAAIAAAKSGNSAALKADIKELRKLLKREHEDVDKENDGDAKDDDDKNKTTRRQIDKLAARVLNFDLKYVEKRVKGDND